MSIKLILFFLPIALMLQSQIHHEKKMPEISVNGNATVIYDKLINLLKTCFVDRLETVILDTATLSEIFHKHENMSDLPLTMILLDEHFDNTQSHRKYPHSPTYILSASSQMATTLQHLKSSAYYDTNGLLFIVELSSAAMNDGCENAFSTLMSAWQWNFLLSFYLCEDVNKSVWLYTYNPFTNRAPWPWKEIKNHSSDGRWTLYRRRGTDICKNLKFDKTKYLDGYRINAVSDTRTGEEWIENEDYDFTTIMEKGVIFDALFFTNVFTAMNVTVVIHYGEPSFHYKGKSEGYLLKILNGTYDLSLSARLLNNNLRSTYPYTRSHEIILTHHRPFLRPIEKISNFYSYGALNLITIVLFITFFAFTINNNAKLSSAGLDLLRILLSTSIMQQLKRSPIRIYLFGVFWLIIILDATFKGNLSAFLTKPERHDVDNIKDLKIYGHDIYVSAEIYEKSINDFWMDIPMGKIHPIQGIDCFQYVISNKSAACLQFVDRVISAAKTHQLHISRTETSQSYFVYWVREDWRLIDKFEVYNERLMESGILNFWDESEVIYPWKKLKFKEDIEMLTKYRPIKLDDLSFAFQIMAIGYVLAIIFFIAEYSSRNEVIQSTAIVGRSNWQQRKLKRRRLSCKI